MGNVYIKHIFFTSKVWNDATPYIVLMVGLSDPSGVCVQGYGWVRNVFPGDSDNVCRRV